MRGGVSVRTVRRHGVLPVALLGGQTGSARAPRPRHAQRCEWGGRSANALPVARRRRRPLLQREARERCSSPARLQHASVDDRHQLPPTIDDVCLQHGCIYFGAGNTAVYATLEDRTYAILAQAESRPVLVARTHRRARTISPISAV